MKIQTKQGKLEESQMGFNQKNGKCVLDALLAENWWTKQDKFKTKKTDFIPKLS